MRTAHVKRAVLLGLQGFDTAFAERLMAEGKLPGFSRLKDQGTYTPLRPSAGDQWTTFATGVSEVSRGASPALPFWKILGQHAVSSTILRVPVPFAPGNFGGRLLSEVHPDDVAGGQGFSLFTKRPPAREFAHGERYPLIEADGVLHGELTGPGDEIPFQVRDFAGDHQLEIQGWAYALKPREFTPWIRLKFTGGHRIVRFVLRRAGDDLSMYATGLQLDPENPPRPISQPAYYSAYLAKLLGSFATLHAAVEWWALREGAIEEDIFLKHTESVRSEQEAIYFSALDHQRNGAVACVFEIPGPDERAYCYVDGLVGKTLDRAGDGDRKSVV
jgi:hypothetical protein